MAEKLSYISDLEKDKLTQLQQDPIMKEAFRKILLAGLYDNGTLKADEAADPTKNFALSLAFRKEVDNEQLGADLRAAAEGIRAIEGAFGQLETYKPEEPKKENSKGNKAI